MTRTALRSLLAGGLVLLGACGDDDGGEAGPDAGSSDAKLDDTDAPPAAEGSCTTTIAAGTGGAYSELCAIDGTVEHVRLANILNETDHASTQIVFGFDSAPTDPQGDIGAGQFKLLFYSGMGAFLPPIVQPTFATASGVIEGDAAFVRTTSTVCFDLVDSTATTAPIFNLWVDGINGADCETAATLTAEATFASIGDWGGTVGEVAKDKTLYFYQRSSTAAPTVTLFDDAVLPEGVPTEPPAVTTCASPIASGTPRAFTELCAIDGTVEHVRLAGITNEGEHYSTQVFFGFDAAPTSATVALGPDQFKLMLYSGMGAFVPPAVLPVFGTAEGEVAGDATFVRSTSTVCFDVVDSAADTAPVFNLWVDGVKGADCETFATLTADSVFASVVDWGGAVGPIAKGKKVFFYQRTDATAPTVTLFDDPILPEGAPTEPPPPLACEQAIPAGARVVTELCSFEDTVEHVRLAGIRNDGVHQSTQVLFGFATAPAVPPPDALAADQFKVLFYSGMGAFVPATVGVYFGSAKHEITTGAEFIRGTSTVCFDLVDSTATTVPAFTLWVDGANGADCEAPATLTAEAAFASFDDWGGAVGPVAKDASVYFYQASATGTPAVTLLDDPAL